MAELSEKAKAARREYRKQWAKNNPDKVRATTARYWERKAEKLAAAQAAQVKQDEQEAAEV